MTLNSIKIQKKDENYRNSSKDRPKILLVGYNGANNTGSEARLISIIDDIRALLGNDVQITVPTLNEENLRRYLKEESGIRIVPIPSIFFRAIRRLVRDHDLVLLVEGSCYMDTWTSALLWAFLYATRCSYSSNTPCIAYAVDVGPLSSINRFLVKREASKTDLIITRTKLAANTLKSIGVNAPMEVTADCAFNFKLEKSSENTLSEAWPDAENMVGLAVVDFHLWPVVIRPWGREKYIYKWPYYFSRSRERIQLSEKLADEWAAQADEIIEKHHRNIALICMEEVDEPLARSILSKMRNPDEARIFSSTEFNASQMTQILRSLDLLVTSRYHAGVLSLKANIPQIALGHDTRLKGFYQELGIYDDYFIDFTSNNARNILPEKVDYLLENPDLMHEILKKGHQEHLVRSSRNRMLLREFLIKQGWEVKS